jgi:hypothetical protein
MCLIYRIIEFCGQQQWQEVSRSNIQRLNNNKERTTPTKMSVIERRRSITNLTYSLPFSPFDNESYQTRLTIVYEEHDMLITQLSSAIGRISGWSNDLGLRSTRDSDTKTLKECIRTSSTTKEIVQHLFTIDTTTWL